jgi:hypothetical protein
MKLSNILFLSFCAGTLLVQFFLNLGYKESYEEHLAFVKDQAFKVNAFPSENIKVVLARGVRFTIHSTQKQQGFKQDVRPAGISFAMHGDTLVITSKDGENKYEDFATYFKQIPTLVLQNTNVKIMAKNQGNWQAVVTEGSVLLIEQSKFENVNATVSDTSGLKLSANAQINTLAITLNDKSTLTDEGVALKAIQGIYVSEQAKVNLSGRNLRVFRQ